MLWGYIFPLGFIRNSSLSLLSTHVWLLSICMSWLSTHMSWLSTRKPKLGIVMFRCQPNSGRYNVKDSTDLWRTPSHSNTLYHSALQGLWRCEGLFVICAVVRHCMKKILNIFQFFFAQLKKIFNFALDSRWLFLSALPETGCIDNYIKPTPSGSM